MKYAKIFIAFVSVFVLVSVSSCSSGSEDEPSAPTSVPPSERKLIIGVGENPFRDENGNVRETRGRVITTESLERFSMHYIDSDDYTVKRGSDGSWIPTPENSDVDVSGVWPVADIYTSISFYAHTAGTYNYNSGNSYVSFSMEEAAANQHDLLLSKVTNVTYSGTKGEIWFTFDHACAAVDFNIQISKTLHEQLGNDLQVDSVKLMNVAKTGDCYYSAGVEWKNVGYEPSGMGYTNYKLTTSAISVGTKLQALSCGTMFIIPQTLGTGAKLVIGYTLTGQEQVTTEISLAGTKWEAGCQYPINIVLGTSLIKKP